MTKDFSICMPCGQIRIVMSIPRLVDTIAQEVVRGEEVQHVATAYDTTFYGHINDGRMPENARYERKIVPMKPAMDIHRAMLMGERIGSEQLRDAVRAFASERFKEHASKKKTEFYIPDLTLKSVEELGIKYLENFGSEDGTLCIFRLSDYHKFAALVDPEAFRLYRNERGTHSELVELRPDRWVLGRYDNDMKIIHEMESMRRYSPGTNGD